MSKKISTIIIGSILLLALATPCVWLAAVNRQKRLDRALFEAAARGTGEDLKRAMEAGGNIEATAEVIEPFFIPIPVIGESRFVRDALLKVDIAIDPSRRYFHPRPELLIDWATLNPNTDALKTLLAMGVSVHAVDKGLNRQPIHYAASYGNTPAIQCLLDAGAKIDASDSVGLQPIHLAAESEHIEAVKLLLALGAKADVPDGRGDQPLHRLAFSSFDKNVTPIAALLIAAGAKVSAKNKRGETPVYWANSWVNPTTRQTDLATYLTAAAKESPSPK